MRDRGDLSSYERESVPYQADPPSLTLLHSLELLVQQAHRYIDQEDWESALDTVERMRELRAGTMGQREMLSASPAGRTNPASEQALVEVVGFAERLETEHVRLIERLTCRRGEIADEIERIRQFEHVTAAYRDPAPIHTVDFHR